MQFIISDSELYRLKKELRGSKRAAFAENTAKNLLWQWKLFLMFCIYFSFKPLPASIECICLYAQFLSRTFKAVQSIQNYISGVRTLHSLVEIEYIAKDSIDLRLTLRGLKRVKGHKPRQAAPLSPHILRKMYAQLEFAKPVDVVMWALLLVGFFTMSRKSNLVTTGREKFNPKRQLSRSDILVGSKGLVVIFRWSKTNQFCDRVHMVPIVAIPGSVLCPVSAYKRMLETLPGHDALPAFFIRVGGVPRPVTYYLLQDFIKKGVTKLGLEPKLFSSHSLRRAGATWAFRSEVPGELIKSHGDWASECYLRYLDFSTEERLRVAQKMSRAIRKEFVDC